MFGIGLDTTLTAAGRLLDLVAQADRDGLDLFTTDDHPYLATRLEAYATLGFALGRTTRIAGAVNVTNLPLRPAPMLARTLAGLSALSGGRVILGVGAGGSAPDIARMVAAPLPPAAAVRALEETIVLIRSLFGGGPPVTFDGEFHRVRDLDPAPMAAPPVWTGSVGPKSLAVTGRVADGWIPGHAADWRSERVRAGRLIIDKAAADAGRDPADVRTVHNLPGRITDRPLPRTRGDDGRWIGGSAAQWAEELTGAMREHRAAGFIYFPVRDGTPADVALARWAREVVPAVRAGVQ